jgi:peroxiredoxin Q/BCP
MLSPMAKLKVGDKAPDFALPGTGGKTYRLEDYRGRKLVLAFYPGDFTAVCTTQFCSSRDQSDKLDGLGADVLGISPQSVESHERFVQEKSLNVPLLADEDKEVARAYGVLAGPMVRRAIFVIDEQGVVRHRKVTLAGLTYESVDDLQRAVAAAG